MAPNIFISYRKDDSKWNTQILYDRLLQFFPKKSLFKDFNTIKAGENYRTSIDKALRKCNVLLVVIGKNWLSITGNDGRRRLDNPNDLVRIEIATALQRNIRVIPVLFDDIEMPAESDLPKDLQPLPLRQCVSVTETNFDYDIRHLAEEIKNKEIEPAKKFTFASLLKYRIIIPAVMFLIAGWMSNKVAGIQSLQVTYLVILVLISLITSLLVSALIKKRIDESARTTFQKIAIGSFALFFVMLLAYTYYFQQHTFKYRGFGGKNAIYVKGNEYTGLAESLKVSRPHMNDADMLRKLLGGPQESARLWTATSLTAARFYLILLFACSIMFCSVGASILLELLYYKYKPR